MSRSWTTSQKDQDPTEEFNSPASLSHFPLGGSRGPKIAIEARPLSRDPARIDAPQVGGGK